MKRKPLNYAAADAISHGIAGLGPPGYYTRSQVAALIGRSVTTIKVWERTIGEDGEPLIKPDADLKVGALPGMVKLYSKRYVDTRIRAVADSMKPGRKPRSKDVDIAAAG